MPNLIKPLKSLAVKSIAYLLLFFQKKPTYILILGHMRSGSSLLTHILCSNSEILGAGETWTTFESSRMDHKILTKIFFLRKKIFLIRRYLLDKILHNELISPEIIEKCEDCYIIFLLRSPAETIHSLIDFFPKNTEENLVNYYNARLKMLSVFASKIPPSSKCFFLTYSDITDHSDEALTKLSTFLNLKTNLKPEYKTMKSTGLVGIGDTSQFIFQGKISKSNKAPKKELRKELLENAETIYQNCVKDIRSRSTSIHEINL